MAEELKGRAKSIAAMEPYRFKKGHIPPRVHGPGASSLYHKAVSLARRDSPECILTLIEIRKQRADLKAAAVAADKIYRYAWGKLADNPPEPEPGAMDEEMRRRALASLSPEQLAALREIVTTMREAAAPAAPPEPSADQGADLEPEDAEIEIITPDGRVIPGQSD